MKKSSERKENMFCLFNYSSQQEESGQWGDVAG